MLFGDDALYYQIVHDAHDPDPAVAWRHRPFVRTLARSTTDREPAAETTMSFTRLHAGLRAFIRRMDPEPAPGAACCAPACC